MPTFQKTETVDARQFTGGGDNGTSLIYWVNHHEGKALWISDQSFPYRKDPKNPEHIRLYAHPYGLQFEKAYIGDWIMRHQDGHFAVVRPEELAAEYKEV